MAETKFIQALVDENQFLKDENRRLIKELKEYYSKERVNDD